MIRKIWPFQLPNMDPEMLAKLVFCFENDPERSDGIISGAQDAIGICMPGLVRHWYDNRFWPEKIESCHDEEVLCWLEDHLCMIPMFPRRPGCSVVEGKDITKPKVEALAKAADDCWNAILAIDIDRFASAYKASFDAQVAMFPAMIQPGVQEYIDRYAPMDGVLAWKSGYDPYPERGAAAKVRPARHAAAELARRPDGVDRDAGRRRPASV